MNISCICEPPSWISDFRLHNTVSKNSFIEFLDPENMGVAVGIFFIGIIGAEIRWGVILPPRWPYKGGEKPCPGKG